MKQAKEGAGIVLAIEIALGLLLSVFSFFFFVELTERVLESSGYLDSGIAQFIYGIRTPTLTSIVTIITFFGDEIVLTIEALLFIAFTWKTHRREAILFAAVLVMAVILNIVLKELIQRPRPAIDPLFTLQTYSFPSGHAMNSFVFYALFSRFIYHFTHKSELGFIVAFCSIILIFLIGLSRVYLGVHYLSDVIAGFVAGFWIVITAILMERTLVFYRLFRQRRTS